METRHCRICFTSGNELMEIFDQIRENFYLLTNIQLVNSKSLSNLICQDCKDKLKSTREYVKLLAENEIRLTSSYYHNIKIENEKFDSEYKQVLNTQRSDLQINKSNPGEKGKLPEDIAESSALLRKNNLKISKEKYRKSLKLNNEITRRLKTTSKKLDRTLNCDLCHKKFHQKSSLECHMHVHLKIQPNSCPENFEKSFYNKQGLHFRYRMHHQVQIKEFICEICAKTFKQSHLLKEHIDAKHGGVRYKCTFEGCNNEYNTSSGLKRHKSIHECNIVQCESCGDLFRTEYLLNEHVRTNHKERKFVCEYEGCDKKFLIKAHLRDHLKMHTGKKDFICKLCGASYHKNRNLIRHIEVVHQKSRFYCQIEGCNASLCNKDNYRAHLRKVHASHPNITELLIGIAKMKPVFLENVEETNK